jgi:hypothetical protein
MTEKWENDDLRRAVVAAGDYAAIASIAMSSTRRNLNK